MKISKFNFNDHAIITLILITIGCLLIGLSLGFLVGVGSFFIGFALIPNLKR